jgi:hypothetical protein
MIGVGVPTDFKTLTAATQDGREFKATVRMQGNVEGRDN